jgi:hypothetical protein
MTKIITDLENYTREELKSLWQRIDNTKLKSVKECRK